MNKTLIPPYSFCSRSFFFSIFLALKHLSLRRKTQKEKELFVQGDSRQIKQKLRYRICLYNINRTPCHTYFEQACLLLSYCFLHIVQMFFKKEISSMLTQDYTVAICAWVLGRNCTHNNCNCPYSTYH